MAWVGTAISDPMIIDIHRMHLSPSGPGLTPLPPDLYFHACRQCPSPDVSCDCASRALYSRGPVYCQNDLRSSHYSSTRSRRHKSHSIFSRTPQCSNNDSDTAHNDDHDEPTTATALPISEPMQLSAAACVVTGTLAQNLILILNKIFY